MAATDDSLLNEQVAYYRARAGEYDRWFFRQGRYDRGAAASEAWFAEVEQVRAALARVPIAGAEVVELAAGTGIWTELLVDRAVHVTAVDASPEVFDESRLRLGPRTDRVTYLLADLFSWKPDRAWDAAVFCFWLSHVPMDRVDAFLEQVAALVHPGGHVFFVDSKPQPLSTASDHVLPSDGGEVMVRKLDDGRQFRIVKNFGTPRDIAERFRDAGIDLLVSETANYFQYGQGTVRGRRS
jgi:ubiquinone/menaquinone biosynthesis C-methylase UbiE